MSVISIEPVRKIPRILWLWKLHYGAWRCKRRSREDRRPWAWRDYCGLEFGWTSRITNKNVEELQTKRFKYYQPSGEFGDVIVVRPDETLVKEAGDSIFDAIGRDEMSVISIEPVRKIPRILWLWKLHYGAWRCKRRSREDRRPWAWRDYCGLEFGRTSRIPKKNVEELQTKRVNRNWNQSRARKEGKTKIEKETTRRRDKDNR